MILTCAALAFPEESVAVIVTVHSRPLPLPDRSARSCRVILPYAHKFNRYVAL
jgi:hypothetical protein